jgi:hypothetical protein
MPSGDSRYWKRALAAAAAEVLGPMHCRLTVDVRQPHSYVLRLSECQQAGL